VLLVLRALASSGLVSAAEEGEGLVGLLLL